MSRTSANTISLCLIGSGMFVWAYAGRPLVSNPDLKVPLNPLGINGSPYGEVLAMAMQGPIDTYFHGAMGTGVSHQSAGTCDSSHGTKAVTTDLSTPKIFRIPQPEAQVTNTKTSQSSRGKDFEGFLASLSQLETISTNPNAPSEAHKRYLRDQTERKLRFAYNLDPSHYGNYNSLNLFLAEGLTSSPGAKSSLVKLAEDTIQYCLKKDDDPRSLLTAAAAATNILQLMFSVQGDEEHRFTTAQMRQSLTVLDHSLARYAAISKKWDESKQWDFLSNQRITECEDRYSFIRKIREACEKTIIRLEGNHQPQVSN